MTKLASLVLCLAAFAFTGCSHIYFARIPEVQRGTKSAEGKVPDLTPFLQANGFTEEKVSIFRDAWTTAPSPGNELIRLSEKWLKVFGKVTDGYVLIAEFWSNDVYVIRVTASSGRQPYADDAILKLKAYLSQAYPDLKVVYEQSTHFDPT
jgi:hypothetical protein